MTTLAHTAPQHHVRAYFGTLLLALALTGCNLSDSLLNPAAPPQSAAGLTSRSSGARADAARVATLLGLADQVRLQVHRGNALVIDTLVALQPASGVRDHRRSAGADHR